MDSVRFWKNQLEQFQKKSPIQIAIVGNKIDRVEQREVHPEDIEKLGVQDDIIVTETSAKTGMNLQEVFLAVGMA